MRYGCLTEGKATFFSVLISLFHLIPVFATIFCSYLGPSLSTMMVNAGLITFKKIEETNPREIEMVLRLYY